MRIKYHNEIIRDRSFIHSLLLIRGHSLDRNQEAWQEIAPNYDCLLHRYQQSIKELVMALEICLQKELDKNINRRPEDAKE